jgi:hypothetical protein
MLTSEQDSEADLSTQLDDERRERLERLRRTLDRRLARLEEIEYEMYAADLDENRGLSLSLRDEQASLASMVEPLEAEIYALEYRKPARPAPRT